ncbi:MAG: hypothetical protein LBM96_05145 [Methanobrevibacter sp.]|jgi:hypothetical protein|nr:hypothetical protein [Candidatus Methanoflexus mossambicus]
MIIGLDKVFKPIWVYKILKLTKPGIEVKSLQDEFYDIIEYDGLTAKRKTLTIIKRYYLNIEKNKGKFYFASSYLHKLSLKYSYESLKTLLLFVLLMNCPIANFLTLKINKLFITTEEINSDILRSIAKDKYGDRRIVSFAVNYFLTILSYFDVLNKDKNKYIWKNRKLTVSNDILKEILILYAQFRDNFEIDISSIYDDISFSFIDLNNLESVLMEYNGVDWVYQKRFNSKKAIVKNKYKHLKI